MTLDDLPFDYPSEANPAAPKPKCRRHRWAFYPCTEHPDGGCSVDETGWRCSSCGVPRNEKAARRGRNNRARGGRAELDVARQIGGNKMGPLGLPWDVVMPGYARLQVRKYLRPESLKKIAAELARIGSGAEMPGYVWIQPGRGGERLIVFRLKDFSERHGVHVDE